MIPLSKPDISEKEINAVINTLQSWCLALWPNLKEFEKIWAQVAGTRYASAVNSGTSWLHVIVRALWIWENNAVFCPSFTFVASANCFVYEWAMPIFVDIEEDTYNLDPLFIQNYIDKNCSFDWKILSDNKSWKHIKAIVWVHVWWHPFQIDEIQLICNKYNLFLIEDSAEAIWSEYKWQKVGQSWEASIFAFYPNKQLTTWEGWIITTNNKEHHVLFESLKNQWRWDNRQWLSHDKLWYNYRLSEVNASLWIEQLKRLDEIIKKRNTVASKYDQLFKKYPNIIQIPTIKSYCTLYSRFVYVIEIKKDVEISDLILFLGRKGIQSKNYFSPVHLQEYYINTFKTNTCNLPVTNRVSQRTLAIPFYNSLQEEDINYIVETIVTFLQA